MNQSIDAPPTCLLKLEPIVIDGERAIADIVDDPACHFLPAPAFSVRDGFALAYNLGNSLFSCARDAAVRQHPVPGRLWHWFPKTGRFHLGFVLVDDPDRSFSFEFIVQRQPLFRLTASRADGLRHIYFTPEAYDVEYAQTLELRFAGDGARQAVEGLVFLAEAPAARLARLAPIRVRRQALAVDNPPLREFHLVNPGVFPLAGELLRLPLPAPWPPGTRLQAGRRHLPFAISANHLAEVRVDGCPRPRTTIKATATAEHQGNTIAASPGLTVAATDRQATVADGSRTWQINIDNGGFQIADGNRRWQFTPVLIGETGDLAPTAARLTVVDHSPLSACLEASFAYDGWLHATRLRLVAGSTRLELEHLLESHTAEPFGYLSRYGLRIVAPPVDRPKPTMSGLAATGASLPLAQFQTIFHTEVDADLPAGCLPHSLRWQDTQFTVQDMSCSAPIALTADPTSLQLDLLPPADQVRLDPDAEYRLRNQFFLDNGRYKLRGGLARRHFSCLQTVAPTAPHAVLYEATRLDQPPFLHASLYQDGLHQLDNPPFARRAVYQKTLRRWLDQYLANQTAVRAFGFFGYGDWFGERVNNWGNSEYDSPYAWLTHFLATGDPELRRLGFAAARHQMDVDTIHGDRPQANWQITHSMAHGGGYFPDEFRPGAYAHGGVGVAHNWVEGMLLYERLTGDRRARDQAGKLLDDLADPERLRTWYFTTGRDAGWHLIHLCAGYRFLGQPRYLEAAATLVDKILERQRHDGCFRRVLYSDHCLCYPKHTGEVSFMMGFLLEGLKRFHALTGDSLVETAILRLARSVVADMWDDQRALFHYTSCPHSNPIESAMMIEGLSYAARLAGDQRLLARWRRELRRIAAADIPPRIVAGQLKYGDGACGKILSQRLRMFADVCHELLAPHTPGR